MDSFVGEMSMSNDKCRSRRHAVMLSFIGMVKSGHAPPIGFPVDLYKLSKMKKPLCPDCGAALMRTLPI